jgi:transcription factor TFIIIB component B''
VTGEVTSQRKRRKGKKPRPEDREAHEIDVDTVTMSSLTKDSGLGQRSATGKELEENWREIEARWREGPEENRRRAKAKSQQEKESRKVAQRQAAQSLEDQLQGPISSTIAPQTMIVNGTLVMDPRYREVDFSSNLEQRVEEDRGTARDIRKVDRYVNSNRVGKNAGRQGNPNSWDEESTDLFYKGLRMFGTDFEMTVLLFPGRGRREIKSKYTRELRKDPDRVESNLKDRESWTLDDISELTGGRDEPWEDPAKLDEELKEQEARMRAEDEERKRQEGLLASIEEADNPLPTIETDADGNEVMREERDASTAAPADTRTQRIRDAADAVVRAAVAPSRASVQKKTQRRSTRDTSKLTRAKKGKHTLAGVEEAIGRIDEVDR